MTDLFNFKAKASQFAVMGNPVKHSKSPEIHILFAQQCEVVMDYERIQVDTGGFDQAVSHFKAHAGAGLNITVPYKVEAWQLCLRRGNALSNRAGLAQAVNTLRFETDGTVFGDNTDGAGLVADLQNNIGIDLINKSILIVGAGGAVRGVIGSLLECDPKNITVANRTVAKAAALCDRFTGSVKAVGLDHNPDGADDQINYDLIINATAASLDNQLPGISEKYVSENTLVYDMMYSSQPTVFMKWALALGATQCHDGLGMLVEQAAESFYIWHQKRPDSQPVIHVLRKSS